MRLDSVTLPSSIFLIFCTVEENDLINGRFKIIIKKGIFLLRPQFNQFNLPSLGWYLQSHKDQDNNYITYEQHNQISMDHHVFRFPPDGSA